MSDLQSPELTQGLERVRQVDEHFRNMCVSTVVENYGNGKRRFDITGNENLFNITKSADRNYSKGIPEQFDRYPENTKVLFLPMRSMSYELIDSLQLPDSEDVNLENEYMMIIRFNGEETNKRRGSHNAIAVVSEDKAESFIDIIPECPETIYEFMQAINGEKGGHIRTNDNSPMTMRLGDRKVVIIRNDRFGGKMKHDLESVPLDIDIDPNPYGGFRD